MRNHIQTRMKVYTKHKAKIQGGNRPQRGLISRGFKDSGQVSPPTSTDVNILNNYLAI